MDGIDYRKLISLIEKNTKPSYTTYIFENGKPYPNVANLGGKVGDIAKQMRKGEYHGIAVELLEDLRPILTDRFVIRILNMLDKEDFITPITILDLTDTNQLFYILHEWFRSANTAYDDSLKSHVTEKYHEFDEWIHSVTHDPILGKVKIVAIGSNEKTGDSVVPAEWIGLEFDSGIEMQRAMNDLPNRLGKPPVTYAIIYSMFIQQEETLVEDVSNTKFQKIFYLRFENGKFITELKTKLYKKTYQYVQYGPVLIGFILDDILEVKEATGGPKEVGLLVSRLQKAIRRGRYGMKAMIETVDALNIAPNYNLPEHNFLRVSSAKQLVWRLFISILEDCRPYQPTDIEIGLLELILLVLITQKIQEYKFRPAVLKCIKLTAILTQFNDSEEDCFWLNHKRSLEIVEETPLTNSPYHNALSLAIMNLPMMSGDKRMLKQYYSVETTFEPFLRPTNINNILSGKNDTYHKEKVYKDIILSSYDMHVKTNIILYYQACRNSTMSTKEISGYIWDISSSFNIRKQRLGMIDDPLLKEIQQYYLDGSPGTKDEADFKPILADIFAEDDLTENVKRTSFILLFGKKYRAAGKEIVLAGSLSEPCRVKINNEWVFSSEEKYLNSFPKQIIQLNQIDPPFGYKWIKSKVIVNVVDGVPTIDDEIVDFFDGSSVIKSIRCCFQNQEP